MRSKAKSITHVHLLSVINTENRDFSPGNTIRVLDVGCGDGNLIGYLHDWLPSLNPTIRFELYGLDVYDHGVQQTGFIQKALESLSQKDPDVDWSSRISLISQNEIWPYKDNFFDVIISNQVLEHIQNHDAFFSEIYRTLREDGYSVHLFPLSHYLYEGHLRLPGVHKIKNYDILYKCIYHLSRFGLGKYHLQKASHISLGEWSEQHADYLNYFTNYLSYDTMLSVGKRHRFRVTFRYTQDFYTSKVKSLLSLDPTYTYSKKRSLFLDLISINIFKYISSITLFLEKKQTYHYD